MSIRTISFCGLGLVVTLAGCSRAAAPLPTATPRAVRIGYFANLAHAQAVLGVESGEFAAAVAPAELIPRVFNAGPSLVEALFAGEIDIGYVGPGPVINACARSGGAGVHVIAGASCNGVVIVAGAKSGIETPADLRGRRIATPQLGNSQDVAARRFVIHALGQADADNVLAIPNAEQRGLLERGEIDAAWVPEPWASRLIVESGAKLIAEEKDLWESKRFTLAAVVVSPRFLQAHRDIVDRVLEVHRGWTQRLSVAPEESLERLAAALNRETGKRLPREVLRQAFARTEFTDFVLPATFETYAEWSFELGFTRRRADLTGLFDESSISR